MDRPYDAVILDLDGTMYEGDKSIEGAPQFITDLRDNNVAIVYYTNRAVSNPEKIASKLKSLQIDPEVSSRQIITGATVTAHALSREDNILRQERIQRAFVVGMPALKSALEDEDITVTNDTEKQPECVVVGFVDSTRIKKEIVAMECELAIRLIGDGLPFVATNPDDHILVEKGDVREIGPMLDEIRHATGVAPIVCGKPYPIGAVLAREELEYQIKSMGVADTLDRSRILMVGDNLRTDILFGEAAGIGTALILTGVTKNHHVVSNHRELRGIVLGENND